MYSNAGFGGLVDGAIWPGLLIQSNPIQSNPNAGVGGLVDGAIWPGLLSNPVQIESNPIQTQGLVGWWMVRSGLDYYPIQSNPIQSNPNAGFGGLVDGAIWPGRAY
jgi:hypothetical protein